MTLFQNSSTSASPFSRPTSSFIYLRRRLDSSYALLGAVFFLSIPIVVKLSITAYIDLGVIFFSFASLFSSEMDRKRISIKIYCFLSDYVWAGAGHKIQCFDHIAAVHSVCPLCILPLQRRFQNGLFSGRIPGIGFLVHCTSGFSPWMVRNYQWKKNPIYPFYDHVFNPPDLPFRILMKSRVESQTWHLYRAGSPLRGNMAGYGSLAGEDLFSRGRTAIPSILMESSARFF
jgi:hypothetical protein